MNILLMQVVDRYIGQFICFILSAFYRRKKKLPKVLRRVTIIKMWGIGSIVLMTPMLKALKEEQKDLEYSFVTFTGNEVIPKIYGITHNVYPIRRNSFLIFLFDTIKTIIIIRKQRQDIVIDAEFFSRYTAFFSFFLKTNYRVGFYSRDIYRGRLIDFHAYINPYRHMIENFVELASPFLCLKKNYQLYAPEISDQFFRQTDEKLKNEGLSSEKPIILINSNVSGLSPNIERSWPLENFLKVAKYFQRDFHIVFIGSPDQKKKTQQAVSQSDCAVSAAGKLNLQDLTALMKKSFLILTNDSGPLHIAVSVGLPSISFFGTESPVVYGHCHKPHKVFWSRLACSPCLSIFNYKRGRCEFDNRCMREITVEPVIAHIDQSLSGLRENYISRMKNFKEGQNDVGSKRFNKYHIKTV